MVCWKHEPSKSAAASGACQRREQDDRESDLPRLFRPGRRRRKRQVLLSEPDPQYRCYIGDDWLRLRLRSPAFEQFAEWSPYTSVV